MRNISKFYKSLNANRPKSSSYKKSTSTNSRKGISARHLICYGMMDSPFYGRSYRNLPSTPRSRSHVREIPVHFVGSEEQPPSRSDSAVRIQKVFRGFLVRKSVKMIAKIRSEVEEIEKKISKKETIDLIGRDSKERLKVNEMLMSLLFRLDSVRGVDSGVRDCRKAVIKRAIALQEILDAVVSSNDENDKLSVSDDVEKVIEAVDHNKTVEIACTASSEDRDIPAKDESEGMDDKEIVESHDGVKDNGTVKNQNDDGEDRDVVEDYEMMPTVSDCPEESVGWSQTESQADSSANPESLIKEDENSSMKQENVDAIGTCEVENKEIGRRGSGEESTRNRDLLERMVEDNEKMMHMMAQLFKRNEMQTKLLSSLSQRVEQLERAFLCERFRRKTRRNGCRDC